MTREDLIEGIIGTLMDKSKAKKARRSQERMARINADPEAKRKYAGRNERWVKQAYAAGAGVGALEGGMIGHYNYDRPVAGAIAGTAIGLGAAGLDHLAYKKGPKGVRNFYQNMIDRQAARSADPKRLNNRLARAIKNW